jgi:O-antigen ligase
MGGGVIANTRAVGAYSDANYYASLLVLGILPGAALVLSGGRRLWLVAPIAGAVAGVAFSLSRGAISALAIGLLLMLAWNRARWIALGLAIVFAVLTFMNANPIVQSQQFQTVEQRLSTLQLSTLEATTNRPRIWATAVDVFQQNPFVGIGVNSFKDQAARHNLFERGGILENAHNIFLSLAAETGLLGLGAFLWLVGQLVGRAVRAMRAADPAARALGLGLSAALLAFVLQGLTVVQLRVNVITGTFFAVAGMLTALADRAQLRDDEAGSRSGEPDVAAPGVT